MRWWFGLLAWSFPRPFRERFGEELRGQANEECLRAFDDGPIRGLFGLVATSADLLWTGLAERWSPTWEGEVGAVHDFDTGVGAMFGEWMQDLRRATRTLGKAPGFAVAAIGTLALALGANAVIFSLVDGVLLSPLPYAHADRLVYIGASAPGTDLPDEFGASAEFFVQYRDEATQLEDIASFNAFTATVRADDRVERLRVSAPSLSLFSTVGVEPIAGRLPHPEELGQTAVISHGLWTTWFANDPDVVGRTMFVIDGEKTIVGVMPPDFLFPFADVSAWAPAPQLGAADVTNPGRFGMALVGRLAPGADEASLSEELTVLARRLPELYGGSPNYARMIEAHVPVVRRLDDFFLGDLATPLWAMMAAVGLVWLIACANVANLFAVRAEGRGRDLAVRRAIGAGRGVLVRGLMSEAMVVAAVAGVLAVGFAFVALPLYVGMVPGGVPRLADVEMAGVTLGFTALGCVATALVCGVGPALRSSKADLQRLRDGSRGSTRRRHLGRSLLVVGQTSLALVLLVGSGLLLRSVQQLRAVDPGYDTSGILTFQFAPELDHLVDGPTWARFHEDVMERMRAFPGVEAVGIVENVPIDESARGVPFTAESPEAEIDPEAGVRGNMTFAGGDYFEAMGIDVLAGRAFSGDEPTTPGRVVISESLAEAFWPGVDPIGKLMTPLGMDGWHEVVAVVEDVLQNDLRDQPVPTAYMPLTGPEPDDWRLTSPGYVIRSSRSEGLVPEVRALIREVAPGAPVYRVHTIESLVERSTRALSFTMLTMAVAAVLALVLGAVGLYGVLSYVVSQRTQEIGVRMALGAEARRVRRMVVVQGVRVVVVGILVGLGISALVSRALAGLLYDVPAIDPLTFGATALAMAAVGWLASWIPALRASRVDPVRSMQIR